MKRCTACGVEKPLTSYSKKPSHGKAILQPKCKDCCREWIRKYRKDNPQIARSTEAKRHAKHRDKRLAQFKEYRKINAKKTREASIAWSKANPERKKASRNAWFASRVENKAIWASYTAKRRATKLKATPMWSETHNIRELYALATHLTQLLGEQYHVDHIIPLQSPLVCGLHVYANLRVVSARENLKKNNKFIEELL